MQGTGNPTEMGLVGRKEAYGLVFLKRLGWASGMAYSRGSVPLRQASISVSQLRWLRAGLALRLDLPMESYHGCQHFQAQVLLAFRPVEWEHLLLNSASQSLATESYQPSALHTHPLTNRSGQEQGEFRQARPGAPVHAEGGVVCLPRG